MRFRALLRASFGYFVAAACLVWLLHDIRPAELAHYAGSIDWRWIWPAVAFDILSYVFQGWRWRLLLEPLGRVSVFKATQAIYAGLFTNEVLPMRAGEAVRAWVIARQLDTGLPATLASILVERLLDAAWLAGCLGIMAVLVPLPHELRRAGEALGLAVLLLTAVLLFFALRSRERADRGRIGRWLESIRAGVQSIGLSRRLGFAAAASLLVLAGQALAFWFVMRAAGLPLSVWAGAAVLLIIHLGTAIPNAPANVGSYQFFCTVGLGLFGVEKTQAAAFSFVVFVVLTIPLWVLGFAGLTGAGLSLGRIGSLSRAPSLTFGPSGS